MAQKLDTESSFQASLKIDLIMSSKLIFHDDELLLSPKVESFDFSLSGMYSFLSSYEAIHDTVLYTDQPREFLHVSGESNIQLSGDTPAFVYLDSSSAAASIEGGDHIFVVNGKFGEFEIAGGNATVFLNDIPDEPTQISVKGGFLELNFLSNEVGFAHEITLDGNDLLIDGEPSNLSLIMEDDAAQIATIVLSSVDTVSRVIGVTDLPEVIIEDQVGAQLTEYFSENDLNDLEIPEDFFDGVQDDLYSKQFEGHTDIKIQAAEFISSNDLNIDSVELYEGNGGLQVYTSDALDITVEADQTITEILNARDSSDIWTDLNPLELYEI